ncbi:helicase-associated domain-containing protein, partial [Singulisphaera rosea]
MDDAEDSYLIESAPRPDRPPVVVVSPLNAYQTALGRYEGLTLYEIHRTLGIADLGTKPRALPGVIAERLGESRSMERLLAELDKGPRLALNLFALTETTSWPLLGLTHALACLGIDPSASLRRLGELGLVAFEFPAGEPVTDPVKTLVEGKAGVNVLVHPSAPGA